MNIHCITVANVLCGRVVRVLDLCASGPSSIPTGGVKKNNFFIKRNLLAHWLTGSRSASSVKTNCLGFFPGRGIIMEQSKLLSVRECQVTTAWHKIRDNGELRLGNNTVFIWWIQISNIRLDIEYGLKGLVIIILFYRLW